METIKAKIKNTGEIFEGSIIDNYFYVSVDHDTFTKYDLDEIEIPKRMKRFIIEKELCNPVSINGHCEVPGPYYHLYEIDGDNKTLIKTVDGDIKEAARELQRYRDIYALEIAYQENPDAFSSTISLPKAYENIPPKWMNDFKPLTIDDLVELLYQGVERGEKISQKSIEKIKKLANKFNDTNKVSDNKWTKENINMRKLENMAKELNTAIWIPTQGNKNNTNL